jgi:hypothetical protein
MTGDLILSRVRRMLTLDTSVFPEVRDDRRFTSAAAAIAVGAVLVSALGAFLYGETVLDFTPDDWFLDTVILGSLFTMMLFAAGIAVTYLVLAQAFQVNVDPEGLARVLGFTYAPYALGFFVFLPEVGFTFGILSVVAMYYYAASGLRAAVPAAGAGAVAVSVAAGFVLWLTVMALVSDPGDNFFTGVFVYSIVD